MGWQPRCSASIMTNVNSPLPEDDAAELVEALRAHARTPGLQVYAGRGWLRLVRECHNRLEDAFPNYELLAVKEKYGELAFQAFPRPWQTGGGPWTNQEAHAVDQITDEYRELSTKVCDTHR